MHLLNFNKNTLGNLNNLYFYIVFEKKRTDMIGLKKIVAVSCVFFLLCLNICSACSGVDALTHVNRTSRFVPAHVDKQHISTFSEFAMELIEERTEKSTPDFSDPAYHYEFLRQQDNQYPQYFIPFREFYSSKIKSVTSEASFLMNFRI